ncbi:hypothetical protein, variant 1 [Aphanomyces invadans]|uniref:START domain-containing protein n=2 Tax=Aphanomyces invadans TaxID=157072 RepID=A0A024UHB8_9STRA|nr:hypothetical protein, variant 1 [Aphanomyces invadans]ETW05267.1 hypothetical protein, variant 1 [Aphanomyces invadans]|eukprot:XP_008866704.1 hypothetical protein, variant 1 [Aphanomyces invadans]
MTDSTWNIMEDLQFLIATDEELQDDLVHVCNLLDSDPSTDDHHGTKPSTEAPTVRRRKRRVRVDNYKMEVTMLRAQVDTLKAQLDHLKLTNPTMDMSAWKLAARRERMEAMRCQVENNELRAAVDERESLLEHMKRLLNKKPRWNLSESSWDEEWSSYKLAAQTSLRVAAIHAIADRQFRRQNGAFIAAGLVDVTDDVIQATLVMLPTHGAALQAVQVAAFDASWQTVTAAVWAVVTKYRGFTAPDHASVVVEHVDEWTLYDRFNLPCSDGGVDGHHSNNIRKLFQEESRSVLVWRTVLEDVLVPHMSKGAVDDSWGWIEAVPHPLDSAKCQLKCLLQVPLGPVLATCRRLQAGASGAAATEHTENTVVEMVQRSCFVQPDNATVDVKTIPYPAIRTMLERGKAFERALRAKVAELGATPCERP